MRKLLPFLLLIAALQTDICFAQANSMNILCADCRDPHQYPADFVNFAFNQLYGPDAWMAFELADDFYVTNLDNQTVYVDADFVFLGLGFRGFRVPFWPTNLLRFTLALPDGRIYMALRSVYQTSLPVPSSVDSEQGDAENNISSSYDDGNEGEAEDDYDADHYDDDVWEWDDLDNDDYEGTTWIEDPDEFDEFDDADWCEEC
ncbi:MAG: hypothetical protein OEM51_08745 [Gammaproteobacteria bacterium]|nr:hypothetical protein [Gammaproteobacteria bacterium]